MNSVSSKVQESEPSPVRTNKLDLLERLADDLAHEIKNPLHSLVINLEVLKRRISRCGEDQAEDMLRYVGVLDGELARVHRRIDLLLRLVRPVRRGDEAPLNELIEDLWELVEIEGNRRKVAVRYEPDPATARLRVSVDLTRQLILTLVLTLFDVAPPGSTLLLRTVSQPEGFLLLVAVEDLVEPLPDDFASDGRIDAVRSLCEHIGGELLVAGDADETLTPSVGIRIPVSQR